MSYDVPSGLGLLAVPELEAPPYVFASCRGTGGQTVARQPRVAYGTRI